MQSRFNASKEFVCLRRYFNLHGSTTIHRNVFQTSSHQKQFGNNTGKKHFFRYIHKNTLNNTLKF